MDPSQQFIPSTEPPWLVDGQEFHELKRKLELELELPQDLSPALPDRPDFRDLLQNFQSSDGRSDNFQGKASASSPWKEVLDLLNYSPGRDIWDEWTTKFVGRIIQNIENLGTQAETHRDKLKGIKDELKRYSKALNDVATRRVQSASSSAAAREEDRDVSEVKRVAKGLDRLQHAVANRELDVKKMLQDLAGLTQSEMETTLKNEKWNYILVLSVIALYSK